MIYAKYKPLGLRHPANRRRQWRLIIRVGALCAVTYGGYFFLFFTSALWKACGC
jgi:hypothetical protein